VSLGAWHGRGSSSARQKAVEEVGRDAWGGSASRRWPGWPSTAAAIGEAERQAGGERKRTNLQFQKFQGPNFKPAITFNLGLN